MKRTTIIGLAAAIALGCQAQMMPQDGQQISRWAIEADMPENFGEGQTWDLRTAVVDHEICYDYQVYGDTLLKRTSGGQCEWFELRGDTLWATAANNRQIMRRLSHGYPYLFLATDTAAWSMPDTITQTEGQRDKIVAPMTIRQSVSPSGSLLLPDGDIIASTLCWHTVFADSATTTHNYRLYAPGLRWPVVEHTCAIDTLGQVYRCTMLCQPMDQPMARGFIAARGISTSRNPGRMEQPEPMPPVADNAPQFVITQTRHQISIEASAPAPAGEGAAARPAGPATCRLYDEMGRLRMEHAGLSPFDTSCLPPGCYIIDIEQGSTHQSIKIWLE